MSQHIAKLLRETGYAHHDAFLATDGDDPEWPLWYAGYMQARLSTLLGRELTKSEIVYHLIRLDREYKAADSDIPWPVYYGRALVEAYQG